MCSKLVEGHSILLQLFLPPASQIDPKGAQCAPPMSFFSPSLNFFRCYIYIFFRFVEINFVFFSKNFFFRCDWKHPGYFSVNNCNLKSSMYNSYFSTKHANLPSFRPFLGIAPLGQSESTEQPPISNQFLLTKCFFHHFFEYFGKKEYKLSTCSKTHCWRAQ